MGLATAKLLGRQNDVIIVGRSARKLAAALEELRSDGIEAESFCCDIVSFESVKKLAARAREKGRIESVIHAAGMSPHMGDARQIIEANALGTIHMNEAFSSVLEEGSCIVHVASMSGHLVPKLILPESKYKYSRTNKELFLEKMLRRVQLFPRRVRPGVAYGLSKHFVIWYAKTAAAELGRRGVRVLSVSPGFFETPMADLERQALERFTQHCAIQRPGQAEEIARLFAFCASADAGYLTGVDILCDGGCVAGYARRRERASAA